jgi:RNA polymerase sigma factor for flagellar operon FliA
VPEQQPVKEAINPEELMAAYKQTGDIKIRNQLVMHYAPAVKNTIISMRSLLPSHIQQDEFFNQGIITLIGCIDKFDPDRGASFNTFIYKHLRGTMLSYMRKQSWLPYRVRTARRSILQAQAELGNQLLREPTDRELAAYLDMPEKELNRNLQEIAAADMVSFEELIATIGGGGGENPANIREDDVDRDILREELKQALGAAIDQLSPKEKQVVTLCYYENLNLREIGEVLDVSQQRVSFIRSAALAKLNKVMSDYLYGKGEN